jgi:hypothetical protein
MTDLAKQISAAVDALLQCSLQEMPQARRALDALIAGVCRDAERYRWLRDVPNTNRVPHITQWPDDRYQHFTKVGLDAAIDSAKVRGE